LATATVSSLVVEYLRRIGVRYVFGVPGRSVNSLLKDLHFGEADGERVPKLIIGRHEGASAFMADGYARASGSLGVCLVCSGPGATNAATGILCAHADHSAVMLLSGESPTTDFARGAFQCGAGPRANVVKMFEAIAGHSRLASNPDEVVAELHLAAESALAPTRKAVHLSIPMDVAAREVNASMPRLVDRDLSQGCDTAGFDKAARTLLGARRPLLLLGSGCALALAGQRDSRAWRTRLEALRKRVVERHSIPVATTPKAKGLFPEDHPLSLGNHGIAGSEWVLRYLRCETLGKGQPPYDALLVMGSALAQWSTAGFDRVLLPKGPLFQLDRDPTVFGRAYPETTGIVGDSTWALDRLIELGEATEPSAYSESRRDFVESVVKAVPMWIDDAARQGSSHPILPQRVMAELQSVLDRPAILDRGVNLFCDIGNSTGWAWHHLCVRSPHRAFFNTGMGSMGWASGAVLGGKLGDPGRFAVALSGDGAFFMNGSEVSTAWQHRIAATWIVFQDNNMGMVSQGMNATHESPARTGFEPYYELGDSDLVGFAASLGADAYGASSAGEVGELLPGMLAAAEKRNKPQVLVVRIDGREVPPYPHNRLPSLG
jgi:acetolactate synthase I/II/III large subunit